MEIDGTLKVTLLELIDAAADEGISRGQCRERVTRLLEERGIDGDDRQDAFDFAVTRINRNSGLASDVPDDDRIKQAAMILGDIAHHMRSRDFHSEILATWPAPIAHEYFQFLEEMNRTEDSDERRLSSPDTALLQVRDVYEVLIKLSAVVLVRWMIKHSQTTDKWARGQIFRSLGLGDWLGLLRESAKRVLDDPHEDKPTAIMALAKGWQKKAIAAADGFGAIRNDLIGHGARTTDPVDAAFVLKDFVVEGRYKGAGGKNSKSGSLVDLLGALHQAGAFSAIKLSASDGTKRFDLTGLDDARDWLNAPEHQENHKHDGAVLPTQVEFEDGSTLSLAPFVTARQCLRCSRRDVFIFDTVRPRFEKFDLLDFARGHKSRIDQSQAQDIRDECPPFSGSVDEDNGADLDMNISDQRIIEALDDARLDRNYKSPNYLRQPFVQFLESNDRGVYLLTAPAHVGKSTFVHGLMLGMEDSETEEPITEGFSRDGGGRIVAYHCRKEHRVGLPGLMNSLERQLKATLNPSDNDYNRIAGAYLEVIAAATPEAFVDYLNAWRKFATELRLLKSNSPILVVIDGLDEADAPSGSSPISIIPRPHQMPESTYLLLTSRPFSNVDGEPQDDVPQFLETHLRPLFADYLA